MPSQNTFELPQMNPFSSVQLNAQLKARFSVRRLGWHNIPATTIRISRTSVLLAVRDRERFATVEEGDRVSLEIDLPNAAALPRRCLACRCIVSAIEEKADGSGRIELGVGQMSFQDMKTEDESRDNRSYVM
jgi:hypothetical protein